MSAKAANLGDLKDSGYEILPVKAEMHRNQIGKLKRGEPLFPRIVGYEDAVIPQVAIAILGGQDIILLGERGQAKSRIVRGLTGLLDDETPVIDGTEIQKTRSDRLPRKAGPSSPKAVTARQSETPRIHPGGLRPAQADEDRPVGTSEFLTTA